MTRSQKKTGAKGELAPVSFTSEKFDREQYAQVARQANLMDVRLIESNFEVKPEFYAETEKSPITFNFSGGASNPSFLEEEGAAGATFTWQASATKGRKKLLKIKCVFFVMYENLDDLMPDYAITYVYKIGRFTSYPYFRSIVATLCANAHAEMPTLPSLKERVD